jgi:hypothetical protein
MKDIKNNLRSNESSNHWCRIIMENATEKIISGLNYKNFNTLEISGNKWSDFGFKVFQSLSYPEYDVCKDLLEEKFDLIIAEQVFEHLLLPYQAARNIYNMLNEGGYLLITTPFLIKYHPVPEDCTRWTETGIKYFLTEVGFKIDKIKTESWGNKKCVIENLNEWINYDERIHSLENEKDYPIVVWAIAWK